MGKLKFNMLDEIVAIADLVKGSGFEESKIKIARPHIKKLQKAIDVSEKELIYFCVLFRLTIQSRFNSLKTNRDCCNQFLLAEFLGISIVDILKDYSVFESLFDKRLYYRKDDLEYDYSLDCYLVGELIILHNIFEAVLSNKAIIIYKKALWEYRNEFLRKIAKCANTSSCQAIEKIKTLEQAYKNFDFIKNSMKIKNDRQIFFVLCSIKTPYLYEANYNLNSAVKKYFTDGRRIIENIANGNSYLSREGYIETTYSEILDDIGIYLTRKGMDLFFGKNNGKTRKASGNNIILPENIEEKTLYYSQETKKQLSLLQLSFEDKKLSELKERLAEEKMSTGICVLFYGAPGTGKTETAMQIAKSTGRKLIHVDISEQKSCWYGESEKIIKGLFSNYKKECENAWKCNMPIPILLFNEADSIISKRKDVGESNVAQTENAIQNIILEELENFQGIMIATTNLANNFDKAFERRFLFKVRFEKPDAKIASKIWQSKLHDLNSEEAAELANNYNFSGGEIDNISRKVIVDKVITGETPTFEKIRDFCGQEKLEMESARRIGFY